MQHVIHNYLDGLKMGRKQSYRNLALFPLLFTYSLELDYLLLDEALAEGLIEVVEVDKEGSVPELKVINRSSRMVLILDGEELVGAKQNRIINTTIMIQANSTTIVPVSCVEQGRWSYDSPQFHSSERMMSSALRAMKAEQVSYSVRASGEFRADQCAIWDGIAEKASRRGAESPSMAMSGIYEKDMPSIRQYMRHFRPVDSQAGAVFMIDGKVVGMDSFGNPDSFSKVFNKLVKSYALDAVDWYDPEKEHKALKSDATRFLKAAHAAQIESRPSVGLGTDIRLESSKITGFALALEDRILHLCIFARTNSRSRKERLSGMARYNQRKRNIVY